VSIPVSVVIPAYNRADLIGRAVMSALAQRPSPPAEVIVVDDSSSDDTGDVARQLGATVIRHQENQGEAGARNTGVRAARCDWVGFLDSDDEWLPDHLATIWPRRNGHAAVAATALYRLGHEVRFLGHPARRPTVIHSPADLVFPSNPVPVSGVVARRDILLELDGFRPWKTGADLDMWIRTAARGTILACPEPGYIYHLHDGQVSGDAGLMRDNLLKLVESYRGEPWCTSQLIERVASVNAWDALQAARRSRSIASARREAGWLMARPTRMAALCEMWMWRYRLRRRTARAAPPAPSTAAV